MNTHLVHRTSAGLAVTAILLALSSGLAGCDRGADDAAPGAPPPAGDRTVPPSPPEVPPPTGTVPAQPAPQTTPPATEPDAAASAASQ